MSAGGTFLVTVDGEAAPMWESIALKDGQTVAIGHADGIEGLRCYLAVSGGLDAPIYLGSRSTFNSGNIGGFQGRVIQVSGRARVWATTQRAPRHRHASRSAGGRLVRDRAAEARGPGHAHAGGVAPAVWQRG